MELLESFGPGGGACADGVGTGAVGVRTPVSVDEAMAYVRGLALGHYENFSVLSSLVPKRLRDDFAAVYAFCRWSDDLGDETGDTSEARVRSTELLAWWRGELDACFAGNATHPVYVALRQTIVKHGLPKRPFADLIDAFVQDQRVTRYETWEQVVDYCGRSANPVGRLVLLLAGYRPENEPSGDAAGRALNRFEMSDAICTALQLTNFWQDVRRDLLERDRVYMPSKETGVSPELLRDWMAREHDPAARIAFINALRPLVEKTWALFEKGSALPSMLNAEIRPVVWLFAAGGESVLRSVEATGCTTLWTRPRLTKLKKVSLVARAFVAAKLAGTKNAGVTGAAGARTEAAA